MAFRVLVYLTRIWEKFRLDYPHKKQLPIIVPGLPVGNVLRTNFE